MNVMTNNNYLTLLHTDNDKDTLKRYWELWKKIKDFIISTSKSSDSYCENYMTIKFDPDDDLPLRKTLELHNISIVAWSIFHESNKCYPQISLDDVLRNLAE